MCEICQKHPCHVQCPNAKEQIITTCSLCKEPIYKGESFVKNPSTMEDICLSCAREYIGICFEKLLIQERAKLLNLLYGEYKDEDEDE